MNCWSSLILQYCASVNQTRLDPTSFHLFRNDAIDRRLSLEGVQAVTKHLIKLGNAEWEDSTKAFLTIILKSRETLAGEIYLWATQNSFLGTVFTIYELHSSEDHQDSGFFGVNASEIRRALEILERTRKVFIIIFISIIDIIN